MAHSIHKRTDKTVWIAFGLIGLGLLMLLGIGNFMLPFIFTMTIFAPGVTLLALYKVGGKSTAPLAIPGMIVSGTGVILVFQSLTGFWSSWAFAWILYGVFLGIGLNLMGQRLEEPALARVGKTMAIISGIAFLVIGFFVVVMTSGALRMLLTIALISAGGYLLMKHYRETPRYLTPVEKSKRSDHYVEENVNRLQVNLPNEGQVTKINVETEVA